MTELLPGMVEAYDVYVGEHSQRQAHLGESRVVMTLNHVREGEWKGEGNQVHSQEPKGIKRVRDQNVWII